MSVHVNAGIGQSGEVRTMRSMFVPVSESRSGLRAGNRHRAPLTCGQANTMQETSAESNIFNHPARHAGRPAAAAISRPTSYRAVLQESLSARLVSLSPEKGER